jgi:glycosyltransferase involved in cell wall biosynthesis
MKSAESTESRRNMRGMDFVIIANDWAAGIDNPTSKHRIAIELARRGHRVLWLEGTGMRQPAIRSGTDRKRISRKLKGMLRRPQVAMESAGFQGNIWVMTPPSLPLPHLEWARQLNGRLFGTSARFWLRRLGLKQPTLINYVPILAEAMSAWPWERVYHCVDRWDAFGTYDSRLMSEMDERCCRYSGHVIASSEDLATRCKRHNPSVSLVMHGVDHSHFSKSIGAGRPADLPPGPVVGFFGLVSEWLDQELIVKIARGVPSAQVVLIGKPDVNTEALQGIPNLRLLGARPFRQLPDYLGNFAVGIIPFHINELTRAVNPIKFREMLAGGCPVVSTALPEVERFAGLSGAVDVAHSHDEFIRFIERRIANPPSTERRSAISHSMASETWSTKVDQILAAVAP